MLDWILYIINVLAGWLIGTLLYNRFFKKRNK